VKNPQGFKCDPFQKHAQWKIENPKKAYSAGPNDGRRITHIDWQVRPSNEKETGVVDVFNMSLKASGEGRSGYDETHCWP